MLAGVVRKVVVVVAGNFLPLAARRVAAAVGVPTVAYLLGQTVTPPAPGDGRLAARPDDDEGASSARSAGGPEPIACWQLRRMTIWVAAGNDDDGKCCSISGAETQPRQPTAEKPNTCTRHHAGERILGCPTHAAGKRHYSDEYLGKDDGSAAGNRSREAHVLQVLRDGRVAGHSVCRSGASGLAWRPPLRESGRGLLARPLLELRLLERSEGALLVWQAVIR